LSQFSRAEDANPKTFNFPSKSLAKSEKFTVSAASPKKVNTKPSIATSRRTLQSSGKKKSDTNPYGATYGTKAKVTSVRSKKGNDTEASSDKTAVKDKSVELATGLY